MAGQISVTEARENFADLIGRVQYGGEQVKIIRRGKVVAALVSAEDLAVLDALEDRLLGELVAEIQAEPGYDPEDTVPAEEFFASLRTNVAAE